MEPDTSLTIDIVGTSGADSQAVLHLGDLGPAVGPVDLRLIGGLIEEIAGRSPDATLSASHVAQERIQQDEPNGEEVSLYSFDIEPPPAPEVDQSMLRLVLDLTHNRSGGTYVHLRRLDQTVEYGPIHVQDLPFLIEALLGEGQPSALAADQSSTPPTVA